MSLFFITFFTLYGLIHLYAFLKAKAALHFGAGVGGGVIVFLAFMTFAPMIIRYLEHYGFEMSARVLSHIGYVWMGLLVLFFASSLCMDIYRLLLRAVSAALNSSLSPLTVSSRTAFIVPLIFALAAGGYGYYEAGDIRLEQVTIKTSKIPEGHSSLRIVQISDVHAGLIVRHKRLKRIADAVRMANPDILVCTGDLVDGQINRLEGLAELLEEIRPPYGKYAVTGNHEYYAGLDQSLEFINKAGFEILRGQAVDPGGMITLAGVDDSTGRSYGLRRGAEESELLAGLDREKFVLLLKHRPLVKESSLGLFDLQISGHTHKGQIFPFSLITKLYYPRHAGYLGLSGNSHLYVSRGSGTWGPPIRFLSPPEVTLIELVR